MCFYVCFVIPTFSSNCFRVHHFLSGCCLFHCGLPVSRPRPLHLFLIPLVSAAVNLPLLLSSLYLISFHLSSTFLFLCHCLCHSMTYILLFQVILKLLQLGRVLLVSFSFYIWLFLMLLQNHPYSSNICMLCESKQSVGAKKYNICYFNGRVFFSF